MGSDRMFFRNLTLLLALLALAGFGPSYYFRSLADTPAQLTTLMHWHGLAFSLWMLLLVLQAFLVNNGKLQWHRTLGYSSVALAAAMMMLAAALAFARTLMWLSDPAIDSCEVLAFLAIPATTILTFTGMYSVAIALRERHDLGPRRGSRGVEHHGHIPGQSVTAVGCGRSCQLAVAWGQGEVACRLLWVGDQVNDAHAQLFSNGNGR